MTMVGLAPKIFCWKWQLQ